jgi:thiamine-phosphate pyrophosphorylase
MPKRHSRPVPKLWLMTDERFGDRLLPSIAALPKGSGIVFRHYSLPPLERIALFRQVQRMARANRHILVLAGSPKQARRYHADGFHGRTKSDEFHTSPVHSRREGVKAERSGADLLFVSPLFSTRSHQGASPLGRVKFGLMIKAFRTPIIALGGMTRKRARALSPFKLHGWAAIDSLIV